MLKRTTNAIACALLVIVAACAAFAAAPVETQPLFDYVNKPDTSYTWSKLDETTSQGVTRVRIDMTSQTWQGIAWKHELDIFRPEKPRDGSTALLMISEGKPDEASVKLAADAAAKIRMPVVVLSDIPNQPLFGETEDGLVSYTFVKTITTGDKTWPLLYPMTKGAVRAMDTVQRFSADEWKTPVRGFVVTGASKRGWTAWLAGAVDKRVGGIAPLVYDNLNLCAQMKQQTECYGGGYSEMIGDYTGKGLPQLLGTDAGKQLAAMVDPYTFASRLTMPKLLLLGSNDPYWTLESANLYFNDLKGDKHVYYAPNTGHQITNQALQTLGCFAVACSKQQKLPKIEWTYADKAGGLQLTLKPEGKPKTVGVWTATSVTPDFRKAAWTGHSLAASGGAYTYLLAKPATGYAAFFGEVDYSGDPAPLWLSTTPRIVGTK